MWSWVAWSSTEVSSNNGRAASPLSAAAQLGSTAEAPTTIQWHIGARSPLVPCHSTPRLVAPTTLMSPCACKLHCVSMHQAWRLPWVAKRLVQAVWNLRRSGRRANSRCSSCSRGPLNAHTREERGAGTAVLTDFGVYLLLVDRDPCMQLVC